MACVSLQGVSLSGTSSKHTVDVSKASHQRSHQLLALLWPKLFCCTQLCGCWALNGWACVVICMSGAQVSIVCTKHRCLLFLWVIAYKQSTRSDYLPCGSDWAWHVCWQAWHRQQQAIHSKQPTGCRLRVTMQWPQHNRNSAVLSPAWYARSRRYTIGICI